MSIDQDIANSARQLEADVKLNHQITHGDENTEVATEGGPVPSIRKRLKDIETEWSKTADPLADSLASTVQVTKGYKDAAAASATEAAEEVPKVQAEGTKQIKAVVDQGTATIEQVTTEGGKQTAAARAQADRASNEAEAAAGHAGDASTSADAASDSANLAAAELPKVTAEGTKQVKAVTDEGGRQVSRVINEGTQQTNNAKAHADRAEQAKTGAELAENNSEASAEQSADSATAAAQDAMAVSAIADKFGNVNQAITEATEQADRAATSADEAKGHAQSAEAANTSAVNAKEEAKTAAAEARAAEDNATAIVHNDEGSTTPTPGAYPVADSKGHLDIGWTPLLQAMYPYSGVIGSVDFGNILEFYTGHSSSAITANIIKFKINQRFNINGRFVKVTDWLAVPLPEAESTADRAVAFDDIFLDWNGNIQTYRSITPHRTTTGYDRDAIATEHGYSKVQTGLYKTGDTYALLLGRVARRNQGAYHPVFNQEGSRKVNGDSTVYSSGTTWSNSSAIPLGSKSDAFVIVDASTDSTTAGAAENSGAIGKSLSNRPDSKPYDAIYADDFTPLYYSAKNVIDRQALLFDSFNRAVAGETFSGAEGIGSIGLKVANVTHYPSFNNTVINLESLEPLDFISGQSHSITVHTATGELLSGGIAHTDKMFRLDGDASVSINVGDIVYIFDTTSNRFLRRRNNYFSPSARPQFLMVDIIGSLDAMPDEWKTNGIPGNWLAVGEEGESLIPDGSSKNFKLSRKCLECYQVLLSNNGGNTWQDYNAFKPNFESATNGVNASFGANEVIMIFYRTSANPFELSDSKSVQCIGEVFANNQHPASFGSLLCSNIIGKIATDSDIKGSTFTPLTHKVIQNSGSSLIINPYTTPEHVAVLTNRVIQGSPSAKYLPYLTDNYMVCIYKEMKNNGTSWGDDNKFNIVNKQSTVTDLNGETVIVGQKRVSLPYQFSDGVTY